MGKIDMLLTLLINPEEARQIAAAFKRHCTENHNADFEACDDPQCKTACELEILLVERGEPTP